MWQGEVSSCVTRVTFENFCCSEIGGQAPSSPGFGETVTPISEWFHVRRSARPDTFNPKSTPWLPAPCPWPPPSLSDTASLQAKPGRNPACGEAAWPSPWETAWRLARMWPQGDGLCLPEKRKCLIPGICCESRDRASHSSPGRVGRAVVLGGISEPRSSCVLIPSRAVPIGLQDGVGSTRLTPYEATMLKRGPGPCQLVGLGTI